MQLNIIDQKTSTMQANLILLCATLALVGATQWHKYNYFDRFHSETKDEASLQTFDPCKTATYTTDKGSRVRVHICPDEDPEYCHLPRPASSSLMPCCIQLPDRFEKQRTAHSLTASRTVEVAFYEMPPILGRGTCYTIDGDSDEIKECCPPLGCVDVPGCAENVSPNGESCKRGYDQATGCCECLPNHVLDPATGECREVCFPGCKRPISNVTGCASCDPGYTGPLCCNCADGYVRTDQDTCVPEECENEPVIRQHDIKLSCGSGAVDRKTSKGSGYSFGPEGYDKGEPINEEMECLWKAIASREKKMRVRFWRIDINSNAGGEDCTDNYILVYDGDKGAPGTKVTKLCGSKCDEIIESRERKGDERVRMSVELVVKDPKAGDGQFTGFLARFEDYPFNDEIQVSQQESAGDIERDILAAVENILEERLRG